MNDNEWARVEYYCKYNYQASVLSILSETDCVVRGPHIMY